jgi:poly-gamma-glutamate capsule biosynthesis protein CapA/YwtB (metallophosphatase superfamily)
MLGRDVGRHHAASAADFEMPDVRAFLAGSDIVLANLEAPVAYGGRPDPDQDPHVTFRAAPASLQVLRDLGVTFVSLGNNHALDYGDAALIETIEHLDRASIGHAGAGRNADEANAPWQVELDGGTVSVLSLSMAYSVNTRVATRSRAGVADHRIHRILPRIRDLRRAGHQVIVTCHWGYEYRLHPLPFQARQARQMLDAGASLVLGHGPHYPQGIEHYRGRDIVYSLGNFIFDEPFALSKWSFIYATDVVDAGFRTTNRRIAPVHLSDHVPQVVAGPRKRRLERLLELLAEEYEHASPAFWRELSADYLIELCGRTARTRSLKYLRVPPLSFYRDVSPAALRLLEPRRVASAIRRLIARPAAANRPAP